RPVTFAEAVAEYQDELYGAALRILGDRDAALEATNNAFLKAYRAFDRYDRSRPLRHWLLRIATNEAITVARARSRERRRRADGDAASDVPDPAAARPRRAARGPLKRAGAGRPSRRRARDGRRRGRGRRAPRVRGRRRGDAGARAPRGRPRRSDRLGGAGGGARGPRARARAGAHRAGRPAGGRPVRRGVRARATKGACSCRKCVLSAARPTAWSAASAAASPSTSRWIRRSCASRSSS